MQAVPASAKAVLALTAATRIYLYCPACDMRKSFDGLCGLIRSELDADPLSGSLFVWCNRGRSMVKFPHILASKGRIDRFQLSLLLKEMVPKIRWSSSFVGSTAVAQKTRAQLQASLWREICFNYYFAVE